ncbi:hypothetical protein [Janthinobacterium agaricidamnosum]|uniref:hypothetical protein n=1 Tax=Janthinobacterium agaricidamnosum TaxID=55508 RepID=UPI001185F386|nr:hypothetical protein [Janthinobacterium agaricidamnosum]
MNQAASSQLQAFEAALYPGTTARRLSAATAVKTRPLIRTAQKKNAASRAFIPSSGHGITLQRHVEKARITCAAALYHE